MKNTSADTHINAAKASLIKLTQSSELFRQRHPLDSLSDTTQTVACLTWKIQLMALVRVFTHRDWVISLMTKSDAITKMMLSMDLPCAPLAVGSRLL